jgi:phosphate transport system permease protein
VDVLAGVPSILVGVLGYELVVRPMSGGSAWAGAVALGFMMCPIIARTTEEMLKLVPKALREASIGLGASKFQTLFRIVIPAASSGIITGVMLAVARVAGETAPLLFTVMGSDQKVFDFDSSFPFIHADLNHQFPSLTVKIYQYAISPSADGIRQMWAGLFVLITLVLILNICVRVASTRGKMKTH